MNVSIHCSVSQKSNSLKIFAIFSLVVNLFNAKLRWLLPTHIPMFNVYTSFDPFICIFV